MKRTSLVLVTVLALGLAALPALAGDAKSKNHDVTVEFVSFDAKAKTVTFKTDDGETKTSPVQESAVKALSSSKAGDRVTLTCMDNDKGEHEAVSMAKPAAPKHG